MISIIREIFDKRNLVRELVIRDLKLRYSRLGFGFLWALLSPLLMVVVFYVVFSLIFKTDTDGVPFFIYLLSAILPWSFFQSSLMSSTTSLIDSKNLIKEANVSHYLVPLSITLANMINFLPSFIVLIIATALTLNGVSIFILCLPVVLLVHMLITFGLGLIFSILYVRWRDVRYILEAILLFLFYLIPVFYSISLVELKLPRLLYNIYVLNPFVGLTNLYRIILFKGYYAKIHVQIGLMYTVIMPIIFAFIVLWVGFWLFKFNKNSINDKISY